jgi:CRP-like cAMP-binding protein
LFNFRLAYVDDGELMVRRRPIAYKYVSTWFTIDFISSVSSVLVMIAESPALSMLRSLRILRLLKLLKLLKVARLGALLDALEEIGDELALVARIMKILAWCIGTTHFLACGWYAVGLSACAGAENACWMSSYFGSEWAAVGLEARYTVALYWAFVSVTTVGYGDVLPTPTSLPEIKFVMLTTFIGTAVFAFVVGEITAMTTQKRASQIAFAEHWQQMEEYMRAHRLPKALRVRIRQNFDQTWHRSVWFDEQQIMSQLSYSLRRDVARWTKRCVLDKAPFLRNASPHLINHIIVKLKPLSVSEGATIIEEGTVATDLYIIDKGEAQVAVRNEATVNDIAGADDAADSSSSSSPLAAAFLLGEGSVFGEDALLTASKHKFTVTSTSSCELYRLTAEDFDGALEHFPTLRKTMEAHAAQREKAYKSIFDSKDKKAFMDHDGVKRSVTLSYSPRSLTRMLRGAARATIAASGITPVREGAAEGAAVSAKAHPALPPVKFAASEARLIVLEQQNGELKDLLRKQGLQLERLLSSLQPSPSQRSRVGGATQEQEPGQQSEQAAGRATPTFDC